MTDQQRIAEIEKRINEGRPILRMDVKYLLSQLTASQRRCRAAVGDMKRIVDRVRKTHCDDTCCFACKYDADFSITQTGDFANECPGFDRDDCFEWRGTQAGEESR